MDDFRIGSLRRTLEIPQDSQKDRKTEDVGNSFQDVLSNSLKEVNDLQSKAHEAIVDLAQGKPTDLHRTMVMLEKAGLSFELMMQVRSKLMDAYREIMRTSV